MLLNIFHVEGKLFVVVPIQVVLADDDSEEVGALVAEIVSLYSEVQLDFTPEMEVFYMLF